MIRFIVFLLPIFVTLLSGFPLAALATHGSLVDLWPTDIETPAQWYAAVWSSYGLHLSETYTAMLMGHSPAFASGGLPQLVGLIGPAMLLAVLLVRTKPFGPRRSWNTLYGDARFASARERRRFDVGLELGKDPDSGRTIRVAVKSNLISIAPARTGKSSGLLLPNLVAPERAAWYGPCVVIDPKGDGYKATMERRRALGRQVFCLDPFGIVDGADTWNPVANLDTGDLIGLQRLARALLPEANGKENRYFSDAAVNPIVAAFLSATREKRATPRRVAEFLSQPRLFEAALQGQTDLASLEALALLQGDPRTADPVLSTARQAFTWVTDERLHRVTQGCSVDLTAVCAAQADLFIAIPTENIELLASLIKALLNELFQTIRRNKPSQRVMIFIDEAKALGRFNEIVNAYAELPGYNASLWTFWQNRAQIRSLYGEDDARTLIANAEVLTLTDPTMADPDETDLWSRALGDYTMEEETKTITTASPEKPASTTVGTTLKAVRLMSQDAVATLPASDMLVIVNSQRYPKRPLRIKKTSYDDPRLTPYVRDLGGTAESA